MKKAFLVCCFFILICLTGCAQSPPPGWREPVYHLLLSEGSFPPGWTAGYELADNVKAPSTNHVTMEWLNQDGALVTQSIWRAYTIHDAESKFKELQQTRFGPNRTLTPDIKYIPFAPPPEITFQSAKADEFYLACDWLKSAYCVTIARYRNYVVALQTDLRGTIGDSTHETGLSFLELEMVIKNMDSIFAHSGSRVSNRESSIKYESRITSVFTKYIER